MAGKPRRNHGAEFKVRVTLENDFFEGALIKAGMLGAKR